jgi:quercetin dioxygenase-like cupin family protein
MDIRRIVTGFDDAGRSVVMSDGPAPRTHDFVQIPGFSNTIVWSTAPTDQPQDRAVDKTPTMTSVLPGPGGTSLMIVRFPPKTAFIDIDPVAAGEEEQRVLPGLAELFDPARPGFHATPTIDQAIILEGEIWLELDEGQETLVRAGDVVIQNGTPHAWHNRTDQPAIIAAFMLGAP